MKNEYYIIVEIRYVNYDNMSRDKIKVKQVFDKPQPNAFVGIYSCIKRFYIEKQNCDIISVDVATNALYG